MKTSNGALFALFCLLCTFTQISPGNLPSLKPSLKRTDRENVCYRTMFTISNSFQKAGFPLRLSYSDYPKKPTSVGSTSPCAGMSATCCLSRKEKEIMPIVKIEYHDKLQQALKKRLPICKIVGRQFERSLYTNLRKSFELVQAEISGIFHSNLSQDLFKELSSYLYKIVYTQDFCRLSDIVNRQIKELFHYAFQLQKLQDNIDIPVSQTCLTSLEDYFISTWHNITVQNLLHSLNNVRLIAKSFEFIKSLVTSVHQHEWHQSCVNALFKIKHCAHCAGYNNFFPCDGTCLNALRGCTADIAELNPVVKHLTTKLKEIGRLASLELHPVNFVETSLISFIRLTQHLLLTNFSEIVQSNSCQMDSDRQTHLLQQVDRMKSLDHVTPGAVTNKLMEALQNDLMCFKQIDSLFLQLPEEICDVDPLHLAYIRTQECWNGTARGSYTHPIVGHFKKDQIKNPAYLNNPLPSNNSYHKQLTELDALLKEIKQTLAFYQCLEGDDEDCSTVFELQCIIKPTYPPIIFSGSGSGSGSGHHGKNSPTIDLESKKGAPIIIRLGGPKRFNDDEDDPTETDPTTTPTTASPSSPTTNNKVTSPYPTDDNNNNNPNVIIMSSSPTPTPDSFRPDTNLVPDSNSIPDSGSMIRVASILILLMMILTYLVL